MSRISTEFGMSPNFFGRLDYEENLKRGVTSQEMLDFVTANPGIMRGAKQEEVRDEMRRGAERERQERYAKEDEMRRRAERAREERYAKEDAERASRFASEDAERAAQKARDEQARAASNSVTQAAFPETSDDYLSEENIGKFQDLLNRLQRSKMQQAQQSSREGRKTAFAQGIASMMSNF